MIKSVSNFKMCILLASTHLLVSQNRFLIIHYAALYHQSRHNLIIQVHWYGGKNFSYICFQRYWNMSCAEFMLIHLFLSCDTLNWKLFCRWFPDKDRILTLFPQNTVQSGLLMLRWPNQLFQKFFKKGVLHHSASPIYSSYASNQFLSDL